MSRIRENPLAYGFAFIMLIGLCLGGMLAVTGGGVTLWVSMREAANARPTAAPPPTLVPLVQLRASPTPTIEPLLDPVTPTAMPADAEAPSHTPEPPPAPATPRPTDAPVPTDTPLPPTETALPPTQPPPPPPTETPAPTDPPAPAFAFAVVENDAFPTGNPGFDVFVAVTNADNKPLAGYRVVGSHTGGFQVEGPVSAGDWTENSGAKHYKGGNIKFQSANSPTGVWTLQLIDDSGQPVAAPVEIPFDTASPTWHFLLYREVE